MKLCKFAVCFVLFMGACIQAHSQAQLRVNIPFDFTVGNHTLPAGQYELSTVWSDNSAAWKIADGQRHSAFLRTNALSSSSDHTCSLIFRRFGGEYALVQFWTDGHDGRDVIRPKIAPTVIAQSDFVQIAAKR
jgi:hypothetical protein